MYLKEEIMSNQYKFINKRLIAFLFFMLPFQMVQAQSHLPPISGHAVIAGEIKPSDVLSRLTLLNDELNLIKSELGISQEATESIKISGGSPHDAYLMIYRLNEKVKSLAFQFVKSSKTVHSLQTTSKYNEQLVINWTLATESLKRVLEIKHWLNISEVVVEKYASTTTTPEQVNTAAIKLHSVIDLLLTKKISPADVYQEVTAVINITAQLLAVMDAPVYMPELTKFERKKTPTDVYKNLSYAFNIVSDIAVISDKKIIKINHDILKKSIVKPTHVQMLATLIHSEVIGLHSDLKTSKQPATAYYPGFKTPSHVFQRVSLLVNQLEMLKGLVEKNPTWLKSK